MPLLNTQIDPIFQKALGRNATDYEVSQYKNASTQDLANVPATYNSLNKDSSIVDHLKYNGIDPSLASRQALGQKYGISNIGTAEGNTALLKALQSGATTPPVTTNASTGTVTTAANGYGVPGVGGIETPASTGSSSTAIPTAATATTPATGGSISSAAGSTDTSGTSSSTYTPDPQLAQSLAAYQNVQSQIAQIDQAMSSSLSEKIKQIGINGGVVDEAQIMAQIQNENAPLVAQRKELVAQQSNLDKSYQALLNADKQNRSDFNSAQNRSLTQEKIDNQSSQFDQKLAQTGTKIEKVTQYDQYGNKTGDKLVLVNLDGTQTPLSTTSTGALDSGSITAVTSAPAGSTQAQSAQVIQSTSTPAYATTFTTNGDVPTDTNQNVQVPGTTLTIGSLYQSALDWMAKPITSTGGRGTKTIIINTNASVATKGAAILQSLGISKTAYESAYKANSASLAHQMKTYSALSVNEKSATLNFGVLLKLSQKADDSVWTTASPIINNWIRTGSVQMTGNADVNNFVSQLTLAMTEYAKVITGQTGGAAVTDSARGEASSLLSAGFSYDNVKSFYDNVVTPDINNRVSAAKSTIQNLTSGISSGTPGVGTDVTPADKNTPVPTLTADQYSQYTSQLQNGEVLATDGQGNIVGATQDELRSGAYTPITQPQ